MTPNTLQGNIKETITSALMAVDLKTVPSNARFLSILSKERQSALQRLLTVLNKANFKFEKADLKVENMSAVELFHAVQRQCPDSAEVIIHNHSLHNAAFLVEEVLSFTVCFHYGPVIAHLLLHIEFLNNQIMWLTIEIEKEVIASQKKSQPLSWDETFALIESLPDLDQPTTIEILADAGFDTEQFQEKFSSHNSTITCQVTG